MQIIKQFDFGKSELNKKKISNKIIGKFVSATVKS